MARPGVHGLWVLFVYFPFCVVGDVVCACLATPRCRRFYSVGRLRFSPPTCMHVWCWWWRTPLRHVVRCRSLAFPSCVACCARGLARRLACVSENVLLRVVGLVGSTGMCVSRPVLGPLPFSSPRRVWLPRRGEEEVYIPVEMDHILFAVGAELPCTAGASCPWQMDDAHCSCNVRPPLPPPPLPFHAHTHAHPLDVHA